MIKLLKLRTLLSYNVPHFAAIFGWEEHARVAAVADACDALEELGFGEGGGEGEEGGADGGGEVDLLGEANACVVFDDA